MQSFRENESLVSKYLLMFPLFLMIAADYLLSLKIFNAAIDYATLKLFVYASLALSVLKCLVSRCGKWIKITVMVISFAVCLYTLYYVFKPFVDPFWTILNETSSQYNVSLFKALFSHDYYNAVIDYLYTQYIGDYIDHVVIAGVFVVYNLLFGLCFIKKWTFILSAISIIVLLFSLKFNDAAALLCHLLILLSILYFLLLRGFSRKLNQTPFNKGVIASLMVIIAIVSASALYDYAALIDKPSNFITLKIFEDIDIFSGFTDEPDYFKYLFDEDLGKIDAKKKYKNKVLSFTSSYPINKLVKAYFYDYDFETGSFLVENPLSDLENEERTETQDKYYEKIKNYYYSVRTPRDSYQELRLKERPEKYPEVVSITNFTEDNIICFPYGDIEVVESRRIMGYMDKGVVTDFSNPMDSKTYDVYFNPEEPFNKVQEGYSIITTTTTNDCSSIEYDENNEVKSCALVHQDVQTDTREVFPKNMSYYEYSSFDYVKVPKKMFTELRKFLTDHGIRLSASNHTHIDTIERIRKVLNTEFEYTDEEVATPMDQDPVLYFLNTSHRGNSKHFAATETLLYRMCGIPARYVYGYRVPEITDREVEVYNTDEYAWCEVNLQFNWTPSDDIVLIPSPEDQYKSVVKYNLIASPNSSNSSVITTNTSSPKQYRMEKEVKVKSGDHDGGDSTPVVTVNSSFPFTYLCVYSGGDYNDVSSSFSVSEDYSKYVSIAEINDFGGYYKDLQFDEGMMNEHVEITNNTLNGFVVHPYGLLNIDNSKMFYDKYVSSYKSTSQYSIGIDPSVNLKTDSTYTKFVKEKYCNVPDSIKKELIDFLYENNIDFTEEDKMKIINRIISMFRNEFLYSLSFGDVPADQDINLYFLRENKKGWCTHFASSATLLFRVCGIPSRIVSGYMGDFPANKEFDVMSDSAHAWVEIYTTNYGWYPIEVTVAPREKTFAGAHTEYGGELDEYLEGMNEPLIETAQDIIEEEKRLYPKIDESIEIAEEYEIDTENNDPNGIITVLIQNKKLKEYLTKLIPFAVAFLCLIILKILIDRGVFNPFAPTLLQNINLDYLLLSLSSYVNDETYTLMERIRFSEEAENPKDLLYLNEEKRNMYDKLKEERKVKYWYAKIYEFFTRIRYYVLNFARKTANLFRPKKKDKDRQTG